jgi:tRNA(fMet)-specific endonuclease VapC
VYLFDTNVLSELVRPRPDVGVVRKLLTCDPGLRHASEITRYELRFGARLRPDADALWGRLKRDVLTRATFLPIDEPVSLVAADVAADLRRVGRPIDWADLIVGATALAHGLVLVTRNVRHFAAIPDLQVENWFPAASEPSR